MGSSPGVVGINGIQIANHLGRATYEITRDY